MPRFPLAVFATSLILTACSGGTDGDPGINAPPAVSSAISTQAATVGTPLVFDATLAGQAFTDPRAGGLHYTVTFSPANCGLIATTGQVTGTVTTPGIIRATIIATDKAGDAAMQNFTIVAFAAALRAPSLPVSTFAYTDAANPLPAHFTNPGGPGAASAIDNTPGDNQITNAGATLGRVLFYDTRLSVNDQVACASCHQQKFGFGDTTRFSVGVTGTPTPRHAMSLANARFYQNGRFFWDERAATLEAQALQPIQNVDEMGMTLDNMLVKLRATPYYAPLFQAAFGNTDITSDRVARAIAQFVRSMGSWKAPIDAIFIGNAPPDLNQLTQAQRDGFLLFNGPAGCAACHRTNAQSADQARNTGLDAAVTDAGAGNGRFKAPSLRNIAVRAPYMHDGRFRTLEDVVDFYDHGVQPNPNLDQRLRNQDGTIKRLNLSLAQRDAIVAYLRTFTDVTFLTDGRFSNPFGQ